MHVNMRLEKFSTADDRFFVYAGSKLAGIIVKVDDHWRADSGKTLFKTEFEALLDDVAIMSASKSE